MKKGLNIGAGPVHLDSDGHCEWENSDFAQTDSAKGWRLEKLRDFTKPLDDIQDNSIDYIVAWHILEHMGFPTERNAIINEWKRVLKPGGKIFLACPNLTKIAAHLLSRDGPWNDWFICMVNVYGPYNGFMGDVHRWGYNTESVQDLFKKEFSFSETREMNHENLRDAIGIANALKLGFAEYNVQMEITK